jgi:hypothetical protein
MVKSRTVRLAGHVALMRGTRNVEGRDHLKDLVVSGNSNKMDMKEVGRECELGSFSLW